jgi:excisionase family DNA binding protein
MSQPRTAKQARHLITPAEAAARLGLDQVSKDPELTVRRMARRGELRAVRVSKWVMIDATSVDRWIAAGG